MAEFASSLIQSLGSAALREYGRINGVMDKLEGLKRNVGTIRDVLLDLDGKQEQSNAEKNFVEMLKNVLIPADDLLDEFLIQDMIHKRDEPHQNKVKKVLNLFSLTEKIDFRRHMVHEIEKIQKKIDDVLKVTSGLNLNPNVGVVENINNEWRETGSYVPESDIIGRDGDKENIVNMLRQPHGDPNVSFVAIVGIGGLGKTTLAQFIYNDKEVKDFFQKRVWVCVSENFDVKTILKNMLELLTGDKPDDKSSLEYLQNKLHDNLTGKKYLLVLDDVWNESSEKWDKLRTNLICGAEGSKVVVTTRDKNVAQTMNVRVHYPLKGLNSEESWSLLKKIAFGDDTIEVDQTIESIGKKIAEKCQGIPLAIRSLGGILKNKREEEEWDHVLRGDFWKLCEDKDSILPVLKLSYHKLLPQQRQCFAYCSLFPKDWKFEKGELIQMWVAHGYLDSSVGGKCMEDLGNQFVNIFLMKSFFQEAELNEDGDIIGFKMHDLMHDLAKQVAGDDCCYLDNSRKGCPERPVHVWVEFEAFYLLKSLDGSSLRTLIVFSSKDNDLLDRQKQSLISTFKYLRVLRVFKLWGVADRRLCVSIEKLNHLRFFSLPSDCELQSLHKSIGNLICLQTIKLRLDEKVVLSTKVVSKLINLRHLFISQWNFRDKWLSPLTSIIEISLENCQGLRYLPPLERLPFLKSLKLYELLDLEYIYYEELILHDPFFPSLKRLEISGCTKLVGWKRIGDDINTSSSHHILLPQFPCLSFLDIFRCPMLTHMPTFPNIKILLFDGCFIEIGKANTETTFGLKNAPQHWLQNLTSLEKLEFHSMSGEHFEAIEIWFKDDINYFPSLQKITFEYCKALKALPNWICNISSLQHIKLNKCYNLELLPEEMPCLTNLHTLEVIICPHIFKEYQKETSATRTRIAHIPNIIMKSVWDC